MAATHLTLEEAAEQLGISPADFKTRLKTDPSFKSLVPIRDGSTLRFKAAAIEELGRQLGAASNPELPLASLESVTPDSDDFKLPTAEPKKKDDKAKAEESLNLESSDDDLFSLAPEEQKTEGKKKPGSDSDVRLEGGKAKKATMSDDSDESVVPTEELSIDFNGSSSAVIKGGSSAKLSAPKSSSKIPKPDSGKALSSPPGGSTDSSEFELSLDADSDDFELKLNTDASDEVDLGEMPKDTSSSSSRRGGESGINLRSPADSGISLEKKGKDEGKSKAAIPEPVAESDSSGSEDFELTLDSSSAAPAVKLGSLKGKSADEPDSDSEFELTLDDSSDSGLDVAAAESADAEKRDIFETDFEIPPMDESASEAVALEPESDVEAADSELEVDSDSDVVVDDSSSEAVVLDDEEEAPRPVAKKKGAARKAAATAEDDVDLADVDLAEEEGSAAGALKGVKGRKHDEEEDEELVPAGAAAYRPVPWGPIPALFLFPALVITLVGGLVSFELLQTMWGYQQPRKPAAPLVRAIASNLDMELKDQ